MKKITLALTNEDEDVIRRIIIRSGLAHYISIIKFINVFVMKNSKQKCKICKKKAFIKITCKTYKEKYFSVYYCYDCFFEKIESYIEEKLFLIKNQIKEYAGSELVAENL